MGDATLNTDDVLINEYEAAATVGMSTLLLRWLTSHAPKHQVDRKLPLAMVREDVAFYNKGELLRFDKWLKEPWPHPPGKRPHIPTKIVDEIRREAGWGCAVCHDFKQTCEAAHIDPVSKSKNNHPGNLIWLCSNHHTAYDKGLYGPSEDISDFIKHLKEVLITRRRLQWKALGKSHDHLLATLTVCAKLLEEANRASTPEQLATIERLANQTLVELRPAKNKTDKLEGQETRTALTKRIAKIDYEGHSSLTLRERLQEATKIRAEYVAALGYIACPLCHATGRYDGDDCPVCLGEREISQDVFYHLDLSRYQSVSCPLCKESGRHKGEDCPVCGGERRLEQRFADQVDLREYQDVPCPLCKGSGRHAGEDCRVCGGDRRLERRFADQVDVRDYQ